VRVVSPGPLRETRSRVNQRRLALPILALLLIAAGCSGGTVTSYRFGKDAESLSSTAQDGALLAKGTAKGDTTAPYTRVHASELGKDAGKLADVLRSAHSKAELATKTKKLVQLADRASAELELLEDSPADHDVARRVRSNLSDISDQATKLGEGE
jgi:hypothetical protein